MSIEPSAFVRRCERLLIRYRFNGLGTKNEFVSYIVSDQNAFTGIGRLLFGMCSTYRFDPMSGAFVLSSSATG